MLTARDAPSDRDRASALFAQCLDTTTRLGMAALDRDASDLAAAIV